MPHASEIIPAIERNFRRGAAILAGVLATGGSLVEAPVAAANAMIPEAYISVAHPLPNVSFGLSGLPLTGPDASLLQSPAMQGLHNFNDNIRVGIHESDLAGSRLILRAANAEAARFTRHGKVIVTTTLTDKDVNTSTRSAICGAHKPITKPGQKLARNPKFNLAECLKQGLRIEGRNLKVLMAENRQDTLWTSENEPENGGLLSNASEGGSLFAAEQYVVAEKDALALHHRSGYHQQVVAGEMWKFPSSYEKSYYHVLSMLLKANGMEPPEYEALHPYGGIICLTAIQQIRAAERDMASNGMLKAVYKGGLELTEVGTPMSFNVNCANARAMSNDAHKNPAEMTQADVRAMTLAQAAAARMILLLGKADPRMRITEDLYDPLSPAYKCWAGGPWDDALFSFIDQLGRAHMMPDGIGIPGLPRPAWYILLGLPLPTNLLNPNAAEMHVAERVLITASNLPSSQKGNCAVSSY